MANFSIKIEGLDELIRDSKRAGGQLPGLLQQAMVKATSMIQQEARRVAPDRFKNRTGNLRRSIQSRVYGPQKGKVFVGADYGYFVEAGTRPHTILPVNKKMLAFKVGGKLVFARKINHPGSRPYPFMEPAFKENTPKIVQEYARIAEIVVKTMAGK